MPYYVLELRKQTHTPSLMASFQHKLDYSSKPVPEWQMDLNAASDGDRYSLGFCL